MRDLAVMHRCGIMLSLSAGLIVSGSMLNALELPSGAPVTLHEVRADTMPGAKEDEAWVRFRFLMPALDHRGDGRLSFEAVEADFEVLCSTVALTHLASEGLRADRVTITLMSRIVPFGTIDPDARQLIEVFRIDDGRCIWEGF